MTSQKNSHLALIQPPSCRQRRPQLPTMGTMPLPQRPDHGCYQHLLEFSGSESEREAHRKNRVMQMRLGAVLTEISLQQRSSYQILKMEEVRFIQKVRLSSRKLRSETMLEQLQMCTWKTVSRSPSRVSVSLDQQVHSRLCKAPRDDVPELVRPRVFRETSVRPMTSPMSVRPMTSPMSVLPMSIRPKTSPMYVRPMTSPMSVRPVTNPMSVRPVTSPMSVQHNILENPQRFKVSENNCGFAVEATNELRVRSRNRRLAANISSGNSWFSIPVEGMPTPDHTDLDLLKCHGSSPSRSIIKSRRHTSGSEASIRTIISPDKRATNTFLCKDQYKADNIVSSQTGRLFTSLEKSQSGKTGVEHRTTCRACHGDNDQEVAVGNADSTTDKDGNENVHVTRHDVINRKGRRPSAHSLMSGEKMSNLDVSLENVGCVSREHVIHPRHIMAGLQCHRYDTLSSGCMKGTDHSQRKQVLKLFFEGPNIM